MVNMDIEQIVKRAFHSEKSLPELLLVNHENLYYYDSNLIGHIGGRDLFYCKIKKFIKAIDENYLYIQAFNSFNQKNEYYKFSVEVENEEIVEKTTFVVEQSYIDFFTSSEMAFFTTENNMLNVLFLRDIELIIFQVKEEFNRWLKQEITADKQFGDFQFSDFVHFLKRSYNLAYLREHKPDFYKKFLANYK